MTLDARLGRAAEPLRRLAARDWPGRAALATAFALAAALAAVWHLEREEARLRRRLAPVDIVVAARDIAALAPLRAADLRVAALPREALPGSALAPAAIAALEGRRLLVALRPGDPLLAPAVAEEGTTPLARELSPGRRAVAVPIDAATAVAGFVEPGDFVDAVLVWQEASGETRAATLLEALPVLAVGDRRRPGGAPAEATTAVLDAGAAEAEALLLALERGRVALVLRAPGDAERRAARRPVALGPLLPGHRAPAAPPPVEVIRGVR